MRPFRLSIGGLMSLVAVCAVGVIGLREGTFAWACAAFALALLLILRATLRAILGPAPGREAAVGFALFGWAYLFLQFGPGPNAPGTPPAPLDLLFARLCAGLHPPPEYEMEVQGLPSESWLGTNSISFRLKPGSIVWMGQLEHFRRGAHALASLAFAGLGGLWAQLAYGRRPPAAEPEEPG